MATGDPLMDLEVDMKGTAPLSQMFPAAVMVKTSLTRLGTIPIAPTSGRAISKATSEGLPKDLEVSLEAMFKQCDPKDRLVAPR